MSKLEILGGKGGQNKVSGTVEDNFISFATPQKNTLYNYLQKTQNKKRF